MSKVLGSVAGVALLIGASSGALAGAVGEININLSAGQATGVYSYNDPAGSSPLDYYADSQTSAWKALYYDLAAQTSLANLENLVYRGTNNQVNFTTSPQATPNSSPFIDDKFFLRAQAVNAATYMTGVDNGFFTNTLERYSGGLGVWASCQNIGSTTCSIDHNDSEDHRVDGNGTAAINPPGSNNTRDVATRDGVAFDLMGGPADFDFRLVSATFAYVDGSGSVGSNDDQVEVAWRNIAGIWQSRVYNIYGACRNTTNDDNDDNDRCIVTFDNDLYGTDFVLSSYDSNDEWKLYSVAWETETGTNEVPEASALALFGLGLAGLGWARRRRAA